MGVSEIRGILLESLLSGNPSIWVLIFGCACRGSGSWGAGSGKLLNLSKALCLFAVHQKFIMPRMDEWTLQVDRTPRAPPRCRQDEKDPGLT